jgi:hypothetical protein
MCRVNIVSASFARKLSDCWIEVGPTRRQLLCICSALHQNGFVAHSVCATLTLLRQSHVDSVMYVQNEAALKTRIRSVADEMRSNSSLSTCFRKASAVRQLTLRATRILPKARCGFSPVPCPIPSSAHAERPTARDAQRAERELRTARRSSGAELISWIRRASAAQPE